MLNESEEGKKAMETLYPKGKKVYVEKGLEIYVTVENIGIPVLH